MADIQVMFNNTYIITLEKKMVENGREEID
jgi:hypothetical protein